MPYQEYLRTNHWDRVRRRALRRAAGRCERCGAGGREMHVHHVAYERRGCEQPEDVQALCFDCHIAEHPHRRKSMVASRVERIAYQKRLARFRAWYEAEDDDEQAHAELLDESRRCGAEWNPLEDEDPPRPPRRGRLGDHL